MKQLFVLGAAVALLVPAAVHADIAAPEVTANAAEQCTLLHTQIGTALFRVAFASSTGCVSVLRPLGKENVVVADTLCRARLRTPSGGSNAFAGCVVALARTASSVELSSSHPVHACESLRGAMGANTFAAKYGGGGGAVLAFARCVAAIVRAQVEVERSTVVSCRVELGRGSSTFAHCIALKLQAAPVPQTVPTATTATTATTTSPTPTDPCGGTTTAKPKPLCPVASPNA